jgi:ferredoxin-type protein NapH
MKKLYQFNYLSRILFLLLTPTIFRALNFAFIFHSIYWGTVTFVVLIWGLFIVISPLLGRVGCGWMCFMGTIQDFASEKSLIKTKWQKPVIWKRILWVLLFFGTALIFFYINLNNGKINSFSFNPSFLNMNFDNHYKHVWIYDTVGAVLLGLLMERRRVCRNGCPIGSLCAIGSTYSRLIPVVDTNKCTSCGLCEKVCLTRIPILDYINNNNGLVTNSECLNCGKCADVCKPKAITVKFVWNRKKYIINKLGRVN